MFEMIVIFSLVSTSPQGVSSEIRLHSSQFQFGDVCEAAAARMRSMSEVRISDGAKTDFVVSAECVSKVREQR